MKTKIWIVRHTETIGNIEKRLTGRKDYEVTENGRRLVNLLTQELGNIKFDKVYSSPSTRAVATIQPLAVKNKLTIEKIDGLVEMYFGIYDGWKWEEVDKVRPEIKEQQRNINEIYGIPEQETMEEVAERMYKTILQIANANIGKNILISSHGVAIEAFLRKIVNLPFREEREKFCQYHVAINEVEFENNAFFIQRLADISYLEK
ncbi:MAG: histidine phosphatase family protein [Clostridia bacterium]|nr:histidine phosphatase family protein [Clostridia bacterium]